MRLLKQTFENVHVPYGVMRKLCELLTVVCECPVLHLYKFVNVPC